MCILSRASWWERQVAAFYAQKESDRLSTLVTVVLQCRVDLKQKRDSNYFNQCTIYTKAIIDQHVQVFALSILSIDVRRSFYLLSPFLGQSGGRSDVMIMF